MSHTAHVRTALALLATVVCGLLAAINFGFFALVLVTKATILFTGWAPVRAIVIFGANAGALGWLAAQASRPLRRAAA